MFIPISTVFGLSDGSILGKFAGGSESTTTGPVVGPYIRCWEEVPFIEALEHYIGKLLEDPSTVSTATMKYHLVIRSV